MKMVLFLMMLTTGLLLIQCDNRVGPVSDRDNEYDSGGNNFLINGAPTVEVSSDSAGWYDFDHSAGTGSIKIAFKADDSNFPHDTLLLAVNMAMDSVASKELFATTDSFIIISGVEPSSNSIVDFKVTDRFDVSASTSLLLHGNIVIPPHAPSPVLSVINDSAVISWTEIPSASEYHVYSAVVKTGPFELTASLPQQSGNAKRQYTSSCPLPEFGASYFIVASVNAYGESRSDTLIARRVDDQIPVPELLSVSKGTYPGYIELTWKKQTPQTERYEIYRSTSVNGSYLPLVQLPNDDTTTACLYNDTVSEQRTYYYKIAALSAKGSESSLSAPDSGFITTDKQSIDLMVQGHNGYIELVWSPVINATSYSVYRSSVSCKSNVEKIAAVSNFTYLDTVVSAATYFYTVVAYNASGKQVAESSCEKGGSGVLGIPNGISISNQLTYSKLSWNPLPGACKYSIYRSLSGCPETGDFYATTTSTSFTDSNNTEKVRYYKISAMDDADRSGPLSGCYTGSAKLLSSPTGLIVSNGTNQSFITLYWTPLTGAKSYVIYRSSLSCSDQSRKIIAKVTTSEYTDTVVSSDLFYYSVSGIDESGREGSSSECREGRIKPLPAPSQITTSYSEYVNAIRINWNPVAQAQGYQLYRGPSSIFSSMTLINTITGTSTVDSVPDSRIYYYRLAAFNAQGTGEISSYSAGRAVMQPLLSATASSNGAITLSWSSSAAYTTAYIYQSKDSLTFNFIDSTSQQSSFTHRPIEYTKYFYYVLLRTKADILIKSSTVGVVKQLPAPTGVTAVDQEGGVGLSWNSVYGATSYVVYRDNLSTICKEVTATSFTDVINDRNSHTYYITAKNALGESSPSNGVQGAALNTPAAPYLTVYGNIDVITLRFGYSSGSAPAGYYIYRKSSPDGKAVLLDNTTNTTYYDTTPDFNTYYYMVTAYNNSGTSSFSTTESGSRTLPGPPTNTRASNAEFSGYILITWSGIPGVSYNIYRRTADGTYTLLASKVTGSSYIDSALADNYNTVYYYMTSVIDTIESSSSSSFYGQQFGPPPAINVSGTVYGISVSWSSRSNSSKYLIYRSATENGTFTLIDSSLATRYTDSTDLSTNNFYKVAVVNALTGELSPMSTSSAGIRRKYPNAPGAIYASSGTDSSVIQITWSTSAGATSYKLYRSVSDSFVTPITIATIDTTVWYDTVPSDTIYYYKVKAINNGGESPLSTSNGRGYRIPKKVPESPTEVDTLASSGTVYLLWSMPPVSIAYTGFKVYRSETKTGEYELIKTITNYTQKYYSDTPPESSPTVYWYKVAAYNDKGSSELSTPVSGSRY